MNDIQISFSCAFASFVPLGEGMSFYSYGLKLHKRVYYNPQDIMNLKNALVKYMVAHEMAYH